MRAKTGAKVTGNFRKQVEREIKRYRGNHYLWHKHVSRVELNPHQVAWMNEMDRVGDAHMLIGSRRIRKSFTVAAYFLEEAACLPFSEVNVHSPALEQSKRNLRYMTDMVLNSDILMAYLDERLGEGIGKEKIEFMNRSLIQAKGQASSVDGLGATHQWLEEFDDMDWDTFLTRVYPTGSQIKDDHHYERHDGCCRVITGTIKGIGNIYKIEHPEGDKGLKFNVLPKYNCFVPETIVLTDSGPKEIQHVVVDDQVVTDHGCWKPVKQLHVNEYEGELIEIKLAYNYGTPIRCTANHKFFTQRGQVRADELNIGDVVQVQDHLPNVPNPHGCLDPTESIAYLTGLYLADGRYADYGGRNDRIVFSFNKQHKHLIQQARCHATSAGFKIYEYAGGTAHQLWVYDYSFAQHCLAVCGRYSRQKTVHPCVEHWDTRDVFVKGYFYGDGCEMRNRNGNDTCISSKTVNQKIAVGIARLLTQMGVRPTVNSGVTKEMRLDGRVLPATRYWRVQTERIKRIEDIGTVTGRQAKQTGRVEKLRVVRYSGNVHNLGVEDIHSYSLYTGATVTNCWHGVKMGIIPENDIRLFQSLSTPHQYARTYLVLYVESSAFYPDRWVRNCADNDYVPIDVIFDPDVRYQARGDVTVGIDAGGASGAGDR